MENREASRPRSRTYADSHSARQWGFAKQDSFGGREAYFDNDRRAVISLSPAADNAPNLPPKTTPRNSRGASILKTASVDVTPAYRDVEEGHYISHQDIASFPSQSPPTTSQFPKHRAATINDHRPHNGQRRQYNLYSTLPTNTDTFSTPNYHRNSIKPSSSIRTTAPAEQALYTVVNKMTPATSRLPPRPVSPRELRNRSPEVISRSSFDFSQVQHRTDSAALYQSSEISTDDERHNSLERGTSDAAIYGAAQGRGRNLLMDFQKIQAKLAKLYRHIEQSGDVAQMHELKMYLRLPEHTTPTSVTRQVYQLLAPQSPSPRVEQQDQVELFVVDFCEFDDRASLRMQLINMYAKPGPPSISYQRVDSKLDSIISEFCKRVEELRMHRNETIQSPAHARQILTGISDAEGLVKALRDNELWIRWGTASYLPPLAHLYMHKHPPYYEVRKAVTLSFIAERKRSTPDMFGNIHGTQSLCPPIYSRLRTGTSNEIKWQVTEYIEETGKFESRECQLPSWLGKEAAAWQVLHSSNRSTFEKGEHPYALYAVYLVIIKDFTLEQDQETRRHDKTWATPSKYQYYVNSSSTGVLYRFTRVENSHCERVWKVLHEAPALRHFRCYEGCDLVEACLALSWLRRQPRAIFVLNSFLAASMSSLTLERKKPFHERMLTLQHHLTEGKKLGDLFDMRHGMNGTSTISEEIE